MWRRKGGGCRRRLTGRMTVRGATRSTSACFTARSVFFSNVLLSSLRAALTVGSIISVVQAVEQVEDDSSPIAELYEKKTDHLTVAHTTFFKKWEALVSMEEEGATRLAKEIWTMSAEDRQKQGRCVVLEDSRLL